MNKQDFLKYKKQLSEKETYEKEKNEKELKEIQEVLVKYYFKKEIDLILEKIKNAIKDKKQLIEIKITETNLEVIKMRASDYGREITYKQTLAVNGLFESLKLVEKVYDVFILPYFREVLDIECCSRYLRNFYRVNGVPYGQDEIIFTVSLAQFK